MMNQPIPAAGIVKMDWQIEEPTDVPIAMEGGQVDAAAAELVVVVVVVVVVVRLVEQVVQQEGTIIMGLEAATVAVPDPTSPAGMPALSVSWPMSPAAPLSPSRIAAH